MGGYLMKNLFYIMLGILIILSQYGCSKHNQADVTNELRGVWLTNVDSQVLDSQANIAAAMQFLADHHFNVVYPVVWNGGKTLYPSQVMEAEFGIAIAENYQGRDPLKELVAAAYKHQLTVIPWFEYGFAASHVNFENLIAQQHPEWMAKDNQGNMLTKNGFQWMNPCHPAVQKFMTSLVLEVVNNYAVDGIQGDDRLPALPIEGGYSEFTRNLYAREHNGQQPPTDFRDPRWQRWRANKLNTYAEELYQAVKKIDSGLIVSWAPSIYPWAYHEYLQDWPSWIQGNYADLVHPQVYRKTFHAYERALRTVSTDTTHIHAHREIIFPGILMKVGPYVMDEDYLLKAIALNRKKGYQGEVFFFYEGLRANNDALAKLLLKSAYHKPAKLPFK